MSTTLFITLLTVFSTVTSICTEGCKKILDNNNISYSSNILAFIVAFIVGIGGTGFYYVLNSVEFSVVNVAFMILMGVATAFGATVGYDKVIQTVEQLKK